MKFFRGLVKTLLVLIVLAAALAVPVLYSLGRPQQQSVSLERLHAEEGVPVEVVSPSSVLFADYAYCDGSVVADVRAMLRAKIDEVVEAVHARVGEPVKEGQLLVEFRKTDVEAAIQAAETAHGEAVRSYERYAGLAEQEVVSQERLDQELTRRDSAAAALEAARSRLAFADVHSPIDGVVEQRWVEPGEYKGVGKELLSVIDLSTVEVAALVPASEVADLSIGMEGQFQLEDGDEWLTGQVARIGPSTLDANRFFDVFLKVQNRRASGGWLMRPGMYAEVRFAKEAAAEHVAVRDNCIALEGYSEVVYVVDTVTEQVPVAEPAAEEQQQEKDGGFVARLRRGASVFGRFLARGRSSGRPEGSEATNEAQVRHYQEEQVDRARRVAVQEAGRAGDWVRLLGDPLSLQDRLIANPRDAIRDGARVQVVNGEGRQ